MNIGLTRNSRAAAAVIVSALFFAGTSALIKYLGDYVSLELIVFARNCFSLLLLVPWVIYSGPRNLISDQPGLHALRGLFGLGAMYASFYALTELPLAQATLLTQTAPIYVPLIAAWWLRESLDRTLVLAAVVGFAGVGLILSPSTVGVDNQAALWGLASGLFAGCAFVTLRRMSRSEPPMRTVFYFTVVGTLVSAVPLALNWVTPPLHTWIPLFALAVLATGGQAFLTLGYSMAPAARVGPFSYMNVVFATVLGVLFWDEFPDGLAFAGAALVFVAAAAVLRHGPGVKR